MLEETGNLVSGCWACILEFSESGQARGLERIQKARRVWISAGSVYSNFQGLGKLLITGVYRKFEKPGFRQDLYTQIFRARASFWSLANTTCSKSPSPGRNLYTQKFRARAGSQSRAYTESSKNPGPRQTPDRLVLCQIEYAGPVSYLGAYIASGIVYATECDVEIATKRRGCQLAVSL